LDREGEGGWVREEEEDAKVGRWEGKREGAERLSKK